MTHKFLVASCPACGNIAQPGSKACETCGETMLDVAPQFVTDWEDDGDLVAEHIGQWSQVKHAIVCAYLHPYTQILRAQPLIKTIHYVDAHGGTGYAIDRDSGERVAGSAIRALAVDPPFTHLHVIEHDPDRIVSLHAHLDHDPRVKIWEGDFVKVLEDKVLPKCRYENYARAICFLDPYALNVPWTLIESIGQMRSVEIFFNFMIMDANRNVLWRDPSKVSENRRKKMDLVWGDRSWMDVCYPQCHDLFGLVQGEKVGNDVIAEAFRERLRKVAEFPHVPEPIRIANANNATIYYLFFAGHNATGAKIADAVFRKYRR